MAEKIEHLLIKKEIMRVKGWSEWLDLWNNAKTFEEHLGLLHAGFTLNYYPKVHSDNVCFYLEVADGFRDADNFGERSPYSGDDRRKMLLELAAKAFKMLCQHFFRNTEKYNCHSWDALVVHPAVFQKLLWFFTPKHYLLESNILWVPTPTSTFEDQTLQTFLTDFFEFAWSFRGLPPEGKYHSAEEIARNEEAEKMFFAARPKLLELMETAGCLNMLLQKHRGSFLSFDEASMAKLEELALIKDRRFRHVERYASLHEAVHDGSSAASALVILRVRKREGDRQAQIQEAKRLQEKAAQTLKKLNVSAPATS